MPKKRKPGVVSGLILCMLVLVACGLFLTKPPDLSEPPDLLLLVDEGIGRYPAWSPDGSSLAFRYAGKDLALYRVSVPTGTVMTLAGELALGDHGNLVNSPYASPFPYGPAWSPQGDAIAFYHCSKDLDPEGCLLYTVKQDGSALTSLGVSGTDPSWSPDGEWIAFNDYDNNAVISIVHSDSRTRKQLTNHGEDYRPIWSPDGTKIAFTSSWEEPGDEFSRADDIYVVNVDGSGLSNLTRHPANDLEPAWAPDSRKLAFSSYRGGKGRDLFVMNADGTGLLNLTQSEDDSEEWPAWSPRGDQIAFTTFSGHLYVIDADGRNRRLLVDLPDCACREFAWSPDGEWIAFVCAYTESLHLDRLFATQIYLVRVNP